MKPVAPPIFCVALTLQKYVPFGTPLTRACVGTGSPLRVSVKPDAITTVNADVVPTCHVYLTIGPSGSTTGDHFSPTGCTSDAPFAGSMSAGAAGAVWAVTRIPDAAKASRSATAIDLGFMANDLQSSPVTERFDRRMQLCVAARATNDSHRRAAIPRASIESGYAYMSWSFHPSHMDAVRGCNRGCCIEWKAV